MNTNFRNPIILFQCFVGQLIRCTVRAIISLGAVNPLRHDWNSSLNIVPRPRSRNTHALWGIIRIWRHLFNLQNKSRSSNCQLRYKLTCSFLYKLNIEANIYVFLNITTKPWNKTLPVRSYLFLLFCYDGCNSC